MIPVILVAFSVCFVLERIAPGWPLPRVRTWPLRVVLVNAVQLAVMLLAGVSWGRWLSSWSLIQLAEHLSPVPAGLLAYFAATFVFYWWHRWRHESDLLWRLFHQIHHSAQRLEVVTSFYKHPFETVANSLIGCLLVYTLLGLSPDAVAVCMLCAALAELFYHSNIRTPRWVGFVFQRPEMHRIHHRYGHHRNNYGDITWWDMLFGTYDNPAEWRHSCGFDDAHEQRLREMLAWRDVHAEERQCSKHPQKAAQKP